MVETLIVALHYSVIPNGFGHSLAALFQELIKYILFVLLCYFYLRQAAEIIRHNERILSCLRWFVSISVAIIVIAITVGIIVGSKEEDDFCKNPTWSIIRFTSFGMTIFSVFVGKRLSDRLHKR